MMLSLPLRNMLDGIGERVATCFAVVLPDGSRFPVGKGEPAFTIGFHTEPALFATATRGHIGLMEAYFDQEVDVDGDLGAALAAGMAAGFDQQAGALNGIENNLHELRYANRNPAQAKANARAHYGLGSAPALRAHAGCLGRALREELVRDQRTGPAALRRPFSSRLAHLPDRLRRDVQIAGRLHAPDAPCRTARQQA